VKVISFSLWGNNPKYTFGAIRNAELALDLYPGWICRFYVGDGTHSEVIEKLRNFENSQIIIMSGNDWRGLFWRFYPASDDNVEIMISRDADSRLNIREAEAVNEWIESDYQFHIMRDHPLHTTEILGGTWGAKNGCIPEMRQMITNYAQEDRWQTDQDFLRTCVYPKIKHTALIHDEFFGGQKFPSKRKGLQFVGEVFEANDFPRKDQGESLNRFIRPSLFRPIRRRYLLKSWKHLNS
jgi:protein O-GlcNAc transferase